MRRHLTFTLLYAVILTAQVHHRDRVISFPDIPGYRTLTTDLHQHTVFSDADVWPALRVEEAKKDGLDAISLTDHLEYLPKKADIPFPDHNRPYELAVKKVKNDSLPLMVINGAEMTRSMPPGHANALFLTDANKLLITDSIEVFREVKRQKGFTVWNHPNLTYQVPNGIAALTDMHRRLIKDHLIDGIEVVNDLTYSEQALQIALDNDLTIMGCSDIHGFIDWKYGVADGGHRPVTLVFAKERTEASLKEALFARRTAVWFNNTLIGREEFLLPLIMNSLSVDKATYYSKKSVLMVSIKNSSSTEIILENAGKYLLHDNAGIITVKPNGITKFEVKLPENVPSLELKFTVLSAVTAPKKHPSITIPVIIK